ncbi:hypothetical protein FEM48_Zijuj09G0172300 [Ziziphus jujuba var. spinosa]|uniref:Amidase domain-containing protein n=1 Tax=Ziziphus jujuba var. spinosa TaxID=714518 RepID=A0A978UU94_ZIZJJ|nr:hypothetical protein FEM48_Zijuj09G0172300 [Ziziphus jujuba var. spinosa]
MATKTLQHFPLLLILVVLTLSKSQTISRLSGFSIREATVNDRQLAFKENQVTSRQLVEFYSEEIKRLNPVFNGIIEVNPDAVYLVDKADVEWKANFYGSLSKLHGIPILVKDLTGIKDKLNTTDGLYALLGSVVPPDAGVINKLRNAGAIILGKASTPCGSSNGSSMSVAANLVAVSLGTETDGSILCLPVVSLPISRTVSDAVVVLDAIAGFDNNGQVTNEASKYILPDVKAFNGRYPDLEMTEEYGQEIFVAAQATNEIGDVEKAAILNLERLSREGFEKLMLEENLVALVSPGPDVSPVLAIWGFPGINVPARYDSDGVPFGISLGGLKGSEPKLIEVVYGFEQATKVRKLFMNPEIT